MAPAPGEAVTPSGKLVCVEPAQCAYLNKWLSGNLDQLTALGSPPSDSSTAAGSGQ